jgi:hypothetical protein
MLRKAEQIGTKSVFKVPMFQHLQANQKKTISLVCTVHAEQGLANVTELLAILERLQPEVIFLELPSDAMGKFYVDGTQGNLESRAVDFYRQNKRVELVPVDLPKPEDQFWIDYAELQARIENTSKDSRRLFTWYRNYVRDYGFPYLNSEHCCNFLSEIFADEQATLLMLGDQNLQRTHDLWKQTNALREEAMMRNILLSSKTLQFEKAVFLVGAAHRKSIIEKSTQLFNDPEHIVQWDYSCGTS